MRPPLLLILLLGVAWIGAALHQHDAASGPVETDDCVVCLCLQQTVADATPAAPEPLLTQSQDPIFTRNLSPIPLPREGRVPDPRAPPFI